MASYLLASVLSLALVLGFYNAYCLLRNYLRAAVVGVPVVVSAISPENHLWLALQTMFEKAFRYVPLHVTSFTRYTKLGWEFYDRYKTHQRLGDAWILVTPALAEGQDWQRQRKLTSAPFNENKMRLVWEEAVEQTKPMMAHWRLLGPRGSNETAGDIRILALNVLAYVAFQKSYPFEGGRKGTGSDKQNLMTYRDASSTILDNAVTVLVVPQSIFTLSFIPKSWRHVGDAITYFRHYTQDQIRNERDLMKNGQPGSGTLVSNLVRARENKDSKDTKTTFRPLTEAEILGNIFVYNFAGHDTTAISFAYALYLLVAYPEVQQWVREEIDHYGGTAKGTPIDLDYKKIYPKLKRCRAVLLETVRLYNPLTEAPRYTGNKPTHLSVNHVVYHIPADTLVIASMPASQTHPRHWSHDSLLWRPQRWIEHAAKGQELEQETLLTPGKGNYFPWSEGVRNCPDKTFAQVEFVAVIATLLRSMVGTPVPMDGDSLEQTRRHVLDTVQDSGINLLLQMKNPERVTVRWEDRE